ncbi:hypothetical protein [Streptomyces fradiae]|uniref:hypothetical protein n=1 Tax=Streptomyces fradiae TaxID=1906 RepID=UPI00294323BE|nr:hypothetical protein [Streptomyces fradiae]WOI62383.1 hypothetical protein RYQ63_22190 [Streptomyces fradiae]
MRGDETQPAARGGGAAGTRRGPRHAAPRKSLLSKLQAPAGKALALAAMPTAVLVGMSLTQRPALADDRDIPFAPGPCVTQPDEPAGSGEPEPRPSASPSPSPSPSGPASASPGASPSPSATGGGDGGGTETKAPAGEPSAGQTTGPAKEPAGDARPGTSPSAGPSPSPTASRHPLDPLGVGEAVRDLLTGLTGHQEPSASPVPVAPAPAPTATSAPARDAGGTDTDAPATRPGAPSEPAGETGERAVDRTADRARDETADSTEKAIREAAERAGAEVEELSEDARGLQPRKDRDVPDDAKPRFPCPTPDPQALADAEPEPGIPRVADDPWRLESTRLTLRGLKYHGIVEVRTGGGTVKKALKFTASEVDIKDLHQLTVHSEGRTGHVTSRPGSTSTIRGGTVTMYTEELKGSLFGLIPITFSPATPPPLDVPFAFFTDVQVVQAAQFGGTLTVPGLGNYVEG